MKRLEVPVAFEATEFLDGSAVLIGLALKEECAVLSTPLRQLSELFSTLNAIVVGIRRAIIFLFQILKMNCNQMIIFIFLATKDLSRTIEIFDKKSLLASQS